LTWSGNIASVTMHIIFGWESSMLSVPFKKVKHIFIVQNEPRVVELEINWTNTVGSRRQCSL